MASVGAVEGEMLIGDFDVRLGSSASSGSGGGGTFNFVASLTWTTAPPLEKPYEIAIG